MKKFILSSAMLFTLGFGALQLTATANQCDDCMDECQDDYYSCMTSGEDERACVADVMECQLDCWDFYCN